MPLFHVEQFVGIVLGQPRPVIKSRINQLSLWKLLPDVPRGTLLGALRARVAGFTLNVSAYVLASLATRCRVPCSRLGDSFVPCGTMRASPLSHPLALALLNFSTARTIVPRETSCIPDPPLLDFRWRGFRGSNHRGCQPKRWGRKDHHGGESLSLSRRSRSADTPCGLRFPSQHNGRRRLR